MDEARVPREPTEAMLKAGLAFLHIDEHAPSLLGAYRAMLAAAPAPAAPAANAELVRRLEELAVEADYIQEILLAHNSRCLEAKLLGRKLREAAAALSAQGVDEARTILEVLVGLKQIKRQMENGTALAVDIEVYESTKEEIWKQAEALFPNLCQPTGAARLAEKP